MKILGIKAGRLSIKDLEEVYLNHKNSLLKFAYVLVGNVETAEDIVQDVFAALLGRQEEKRTSPILRDIL